MPIITDSISETEFINTIRKLKTQFNYVIYASYSVDNIYKHKPNYYLILFLKVERVLVVYV